MKKATIVCTLLICLCIGIFACFGCISTDDGSTDYKWCIKIYMPDGIIEGPGRIKNYFNCGLVSVEIDGIQYYVGSQNILATKLPTP